MRDFLLQHGLDSAPLHWYVNYACRDDYGCRYDETSAWMGFTTSPAATRWPTTPTMMMC